jgi:hypothetical protein
MVGRVFSAVPFMENTTVNMGKITTVIMEQIMRDNMDQVTTENRVEVP